MKEAKLKEHYEKQHAARAQRLQAAVPGESTEPEAPAVADDLGSARSPPPAPAAAQPPLRAPVAAPAAVPQEEGVEGGVHGVPDVRS